MARDFSRRNFLRGAAALFAGAAAGGVASVLPAAEAVPAVAAGQIVYSGITLNKLAVAVFVTEEILDDSSAATVETWVAAAVGREMNHG